MKNINEYLINENLSEKELMNLVNPDAAQELINYITKRYGDNVDYYARADYSFPISSFHILFCWAYEIYYNRCTNSTKTTEEILKKIFDQYKRVGKQLDKLKNRIDKEK